LAPSGDARHANVSPNGFDSFIRDERTVAYLDLTGSEVERHRAPPQNATNSLAGQRKVPGGLAEYDRSPRGRPRRLGDERRLRGL
jgi:hypothetical protein